MTDPWDGTRPGSDAAIEQGCTCPVIDNQCGAGAWDFEEERQYWMAETCPLHGFTLTEEAGDERA